MLAQRDGDGLNRLGKRAVGANIVRVGRFFYKKRSHLSKLLAHFECPWQGPLLVRVEHAQRISSRQLAQHEGTPHVTLSVPGADLQLESVKTLRYSLLRQILHLLVFIL